MSQIAVLYHLELHENCFSEYHGLWNTMVNYLQKRGAEGSVLQLAADNTVFIYSRWPSIEQYQSSWPKDEELERTLSPEMVEVTLRMKACIKEVISTQILHVVQDKLLKH